MRRFLALMLILPFLIFPVRATPTAYVALTFDDGPSGRFTRQLLAGLQERGVTATFLLCGYRIAQYPQLTEQIFQAGHEIGLHGYSHKSMAVMKPEELRSEIRRTQALLPEGCRPQFLRPPGGAVTKLVQQTARQAGLSILNWSVDPRDWATKDAAQVTQAVLCDVADGDVILLHDISDSSVDAAFSIIDTLLERGFQFVTASELAAFKGVKCVPGKVYTHFA